MLSKTLSFAIIGLLFSLEAFAQTPPSPTLFNSSNPDPCGISYMLAYSPKVSPASLGCKLPYTYQADDVDEDGFWDMAEYELAWAFAPYIEFDEGDAYLNGMLTVFQASPEFDPVDNVYYLKLRYFFAYNGERETIGDIEKFDMVLVSTDPNAQSWSLYELRYDSHQGTCGIWDSEPNGVVEDLSDGKLMDYCNTAVGGVNTTLPSFAKRWYWAFPDNDHINSGMIKPRIFPSREKHRVFATKNYCEDTCYRERLVEWWDEDCGADGSAKHGLSLLGSKIEYDGESIYSNSTIVTQLQTILAIQGGQMGPVQDLTRRSNLGEVGFTNNISWTMPGFDTGSRLFDPLFGAGHTCYIDIFSKECTRGLRSSDLIQREQLNYCTLPDADTDEVPDGIDCDPDNPFFTLDLDRDGICDEAVPAERMSECLLACELLYMGEERETCLFNCNHVDPCPFGNNHDADCNSLLTAVANGTFSAEGSALYTFCVNRFKNSRVRMLDGEIKTLSAYGCDAEPTGHHALVFREVTSLVRTREETIGGITIPAFMMCTFSIAENQVIWQGGFQPLEGEAETLNRPGSVMVCGESSGQSDTCDYFRDPALLAASSWKPVDVIARWALPELFGNVSLPTGGESLFRHRNLSFTPSPKNRRFTTNWSDSRYATLHGKAVKGRFSFPDRDPTFDGTTSQTLLSTEFTSSREIPPEVTGRRDSCMPALPSDFAISAGDGSLALDSAIFNEMAPVRIVPGNPDRLEDLLVLQKSPSTSSAIGFVQPRVGASLVPTAPRPVYDVSAGWSREQYEKAHGITPLVGQRHKSLTADSANLFLWTDDREPVVGSFDEEVWWLESWQEFFGAPFPTFSSLLQAVPLEESTVFFGTTDSGTWGTAVILDNRTGEPQDRFTFPLPEITSGVSLWYTSQPRRVYYFGGSEDHPVTYFNVGEETLHTLPITPGVTLGEMPLLTELQQGQSVLALRHDQMPALYEINLFSGAVTILAEDLPVLAADPESALILQGDQPVLVTPDETTGELVISGIDPETGDVMTSASGPTLQADDPFYPSTEVLISGYDVPEEPCPSCADEGCGCRVPGSGRPATRTLVVLLITLLWARRRVRK